VVEKTKAIFERNIGMGTHVLSLVALDLPLFLIWQQSCWLAEISAHALFEL